MSGPAERDRAGHIERAARLRRRIADLADSVAITEEQVADTLEKVAENRSPPDAERLRAQDDHARRHAAKERDLSTRYNIRGGRDGRSGDAGQ